MYTIRQIESWLANKDRSAVEITQEYLDYIDRSEPKLKSFIRLTPEVALQQADRVDQQIQSGAPLSPLAGVPIAIKDNLCTQGIPTTCASRMLANFVPPYESTVTAKLSQAGAVMVGKTNLDEFAMGSSTENSAFHTTANPWNLACVPGGSSGGSAAAVAGGQAPVAIGSDTGGQFANRQLFVA